jgi:hypothetical protein
MPDKEVYPMRKVNLANTVVEEVNANTETVVTEAVANVEGDKAVDPVEEQIAKLEEQVDIEAEVTTAPDATATDKVDARINILLSVLPDIVTPKTLCTLFNFDDGGKTIRRHLRKHFAEPSGHEHKDKWVWNKEDKVLRTILAHFQDKYESFAERLKAAK